MTELPRGMRPISWDYVVGEEPHVPPAPEAGKVKGKYGRLTVLRRLPPDGTAVKWLCRCECGTEVVRRGNSLRTMKSKSLRGSQASCGKLECRKAKRGT